MDPKCFLNTCSEALQSRRPKPKSLKAWIINIGFWFVFQGSGLGFRALGLGYIGFGKPEQSARHFFRFSYYTPQPILIIVQGPYLEALLT